MFFAWRHGLSCYDSGQGPDVHNGINLYLNSWDSSVEGSWLFLGAIDDLFGVVSVSILPPPPDLHAIFISRTDLWLSADRKHSTRMHYTLSSHKCADVFGKTIPFIVSTPSILNKMCQIYFHYNCISKSSLVSLYINYFHIEPVSLESIEAVIFDQRWLIVSFYATV